MSVFKKLPIVLYKCDFSAALDHDPGPGIFTEFLPLRNWRNCKNFAPNSRLLMNIMLGVRAACGLGRCVRSIKFRSS